MLESDWQAGRRGLVSNPTPGPILEATTSRDSLQGTITEVGNVTLSAFMTAKAAGWAAQGRGLWSNGGVVYEYYTSGNAETYEYVKLGTFLLNTPAKRKINMIAVSALDKMSLFDREADVFWNGLTYPINGRRNFSHSYALSWAFKRLPLPL